MACICLHDNHDHPFNSVLGSGRGGYSRIDVDMLPLPFRHFFRHSFERAYDLADSLVAVCELCGLGGSWLSRDWESADLAALCMECWERRYPDIAVAAFDFCCEDWCDISLDHAGLCAPK
jgi:hypothetical protein